MWWTAHGASLAGGAFFGLLAVCFVDVSPRWGMHTCTHNPTDSMLTKTAQNIQIQMLRGKNPQHGRLADLFPGETPRDGWGTPLRLIVPGPRGTAFDLISDGADRRPGGLGADADRRYSQL